MRILSRLKLWQKLALLVAAMAVPTVLLGAFYLSAADGQVAQARNELEGARYAQRVGAVLAEVVNHRSLLFAVLTGSASRRAALGESEANVDRLMSAVDSSDVRLGGTLGVAGQWDVIRQAWRRLKSHELGLTADQAVAEHDALLARLVTLGRIIAARSALNVDPSARTAALIAIATRDIPDALIASGNVQWYATSASIKGYLGGDDRMALELYHRRVMSDFASAARDLNGAAAGARARIEPVLESAQSAFDGSYSIITRRIVDAQKMTITTSELFADSRSVRASLTRLSDVSYAQMRRAVGRRLSEATMWRDFTVGVTAVALLVALALSWLITRSIATPLAEAIEVFGRIAAGEYDNAIDLAGSDEASRVLRALDDMQRKLRTQIEDERHVAAENARIRQALDKVSTCVVLADAARRIIYLNETAQATFARNGREMGAALPGFDVQRLHGAPLETLSPDPVGERHAVEALTGARTLERRLGGAIFHTVTNPVLTAAAERIGTVMEWTERTQEVAIENEMQEMLSAVVAGRLDKRIDPAGKSGFLEAMSRGVNQLADNMAQVVSQVKRVAAEVHRGAEEISAGNSNLSQRTEEQSSSLEETASSMEEMTTTVKQNADNAAQANQLALAARDQAEKGGAVVGQAVGAMRDINDASRKIADIIGVIDDIAFQTNLLALNAAVEAARAGEQGRGFAVVASEVRSLAGRSATAAKEIKELIQDSVRKVEDGSVLVTQSGETLERIVASVKKVSDIVAEIAAASREQSAGIEQVNRAVMQMDELTQQNAALVEEATAASQAMAEQVRDLNDMLGRFEFATRPDGAEASVPVAAPPAASAARGASARADRRGPNRPWAAQRRSDRPSAPAREAAAGARGHDTRAPGDAGDSEWQEF